MVGRLTPISPLSIPTPLPTRRRRNALIPESPSPSPALGKGDSYAVNAYPSPATSITSLTRAESEHEHDNGDDQEYVPDDRRPAKKRVKDALHHPYRAPSTARSKHSRAPSERRSSRRTQLQIVLDDLPYTMDDIAYIDGCYYCPFPDCSQKTTSEGDLGRHLESNLHATHSYLCLAPSCLLPFAREDSMKRHHANNKGKAHKAHHQRMVDEGFEFRVRREDVQKLKERVLARARAVGLL